MIEVFKKIWENPLKKWKKIKQNFVIKKDKHKNARNAQIY